MLFTLRMKSCVQLKLDVKLVFHSNHVWGKCIGTPNRALSSSSLFKGHSNLPTIVSFLEEKKGVQIASTCHLFQGSFVPVF